MLSIFKNKRKFGLYANIYFKAEKRFIYRMQTMRRSINSKTLETNKRKEQVKKSYYHDFSTAIE